MTDFPMLPLPNRSSMIMEIEAEKKRLHATRQKVTADDARETQRIKGLVEREYKQPLKLFLMVYLDVEAICLELQQRYFAQAVLTNDFEFGSFHVMTGRALLTTKEIHTLLVTGLPTGAIARWRTLYELYITARFIRLQSKHPENKIAERYYFHRDISRLEMMELEHKALEVVNGSQLVSQAIIDLRNRRDTLVSKDRFGPEYKSNYGWASKAFPTKNGYNAQLPFAKLESCVPVPELASWYKYASWVNHATSLGNSDNLQKLSTDHTTVIGQSIAGFKNPAWLTLHTLIQMTMLYAAVRPTDYSARLQALYDLTEDMNAQLENIDKNMEAKNPNGLKWRR